MASTHVGTKTGNLVNLAWSLLMAKNPVPGDFHGRASAIDKMLSSDSSGLVDSLTDFMVDSALTKITIETMGEDENLYAILNTWLSVINEEYRGRGIEVGVRGLAKEYFKERWKGASFPILKIARWESVKNLLMPVSMFFVDGGSVYAEDKEQSNELSLFNYDYYLGKTKEPKNKLSGKNVIITKPFSRWYAEYPAPYLIKRGVYQNWKVLDELKRKQQQLIDQIIPYLLLIKKGTEGLLHDGVKSYSDEELKTVIEQFQTLQDKLDTLNNSIVSRSTPTRATNADEEIEHIIPKISELFNRELFVEGERAILSGLGFIDVVEGATSSRKESIMSPKSFLAEINNGVEDFKNIINDLLTIAFNEDTEHRKYTNIDCKVVSSPVRSFMSDDFKRILSQVYDRGGLSMETYTDLVSEVDFDTELYRRKSEAKRGVTMDMYPPVIMNTEGRGFDVESLETKETKENLPDKKKGTNAKDFDTSMKAVVNCPKCNQKVDLLKEKEAGMGWVKCPNCSEPLTQGLLEKAPYNTIADLPPAVKKYSKEAQHAFLRAFNHAYNYYDSESQAFRIAWTALKKSIQKNKRG